MCDLIVTAVTVTHNGLTLILATQKIEPLDICQPPSVVVDMVNAMY